jgi:hypothetical protein
MGTFAKYTAESHSTTPEWPAELPFPPDAAKGERRFEIETVGPWSIIRKLRGLAVSKPKDAGGIIIHGDRSLVSPKESGYQMEGRVSVGGKSYRAFTASQLFRHDGKLYDFAILYVCDSD